MDFSEKKLPFVRSQNEAGFTLVEMLVAFMAFCMLVSFLPLGLRTVLRDDHMERRAQRLEWEVFYSQIKKEARLASKISIQPDKLILEKTGETIIYEKYGSNIRRRVNYTGHEILLQNITTLQFARVTEGYSIAVTATDGNKYSANIRVFIPIEVE